MYVAAQAIKLSDCDRAAKAAGLCERRRQLGPPVESVGALGRFDLNELRDDLKSFCLGEMGEGLPLPF
jgi:hypothetical protein